MKKPSTRHLLLLAALAGSLAATFLVRGEEDAAEAVAVPARTGERAAAASQPQTPAQPQASALALERLGHRAPADAEGDPFRSKSWYEPPPPPPPGPPPKPTAPPLPFQYVGKFEDAGGGKLVIYLAKGSESFAVSPGDKFDGVYRFEAIERGRMVLVYLPLSIKQHLPIGVPE
ncbi:MAG TPA: hypothetical protein VF816_18830 [Rhodocyclaceae bacterium]